MTEKSTTPRQKAADDRKARLKAELKANMGRRKAQAKKRAVKSTEAEQT